MVALSEQDYLAVLQAAQEIADCTRRDDFAPVVLQQLAGLVRSDVTSLTEVDPAGGRLAYLVEPKDTPFPPGADDVLAALAHQHPLIRHYAETRDGSAIKISDFWSTDVWHSSEIFQRFYHPIGVEYQMSINLPAPLPIVVGLVVNRDEADIDFNEHDRAMLNLIRPHIAQAWRRAREYERLDALVGAASEALRTTGSGLVVLTEPLQELTPGALSELYRYFGRPIGQELLPPRVSRWLNTAHEPGADRLELARPLRAELDGRELVIRLLPASRDRPESILIDEQSVDAASDTLRGVGLTEREATVLRLLGSGLTNSAIAAELDLSPWTVKRHLANIYAKLGVSGRVRASALAIEIAAHHRPDEG